MYSFPLNLIAHVRAELERSACFFLVPLGQITSLYYDIAAIRLITLFSFYFDIFYS